MGCFAFAIWLNIFITALFWQKQGGYFFIEITIKNVKTKITIIAMYSIIF